MEAPDMRITEENYQAAKSRFIGRCVSAGLKCMTVAAWPVLISVFLISQYNPKNEASGGVIFLGVAVMAVVLILVIRFTLYCLREDIAKFKLAKSRYRASADAETVQEVRKSKRHNLCKRLLVIALLLLLGGGIYGGYRYNNYARYHDAQALIAAGDFEAAQQKLQSVNRDYLDADALLSLCRAHQQYDSGHADWAYLTIRLVAFSHQSEEQMKPINEFISLVRHEHQVIEDEREAKRNQALEERIRNGVPFVGMSESRINDTTLGIHYDHAKEKDPVRIDGGYREVTTYRFVKDNKVIFKAHCYDRKVYKVLDLREHPHRLNAQSSTSSATHSDDDDPYHVEDFDCPEDLYDMYDDFEDLEDAEDYYYSHHS